jgi:hypothetical protein
MRSLQAPVNEKVGWTQKRGGILNIGGIVLAGAAASR